MYAIVHSQIIPSMISCEEQFLSKSSLRVSRTHLLGQLELSKLLEDGALGCMYMEAAHSEGVCPSLRIQ